MPTTVTAAAPASKQGALQPASRRSLLWSRARNPLIVLLLVALILFLLFPVYWIFLTAILPTRYLLSEVPPLVPPLSQVNLDAFSRVFELRPVGLWLLNSATVTIGAALGAVALSTMAGYSLSRLASRLGLMVGYSLFTVQVIPRTLLVIPIFMMFTATGLINTLWGLIIVNTVVIVPFGTWIMKSIFDGVPVELEEAARVDGCSQLRAFTRVVLPLARPGIGAVAIFSAIHAWGDFTYARTLILDNQGTTITVGIVGFVGEYTADWGALMAAGLVAVLPMILLFVILEPMLVSGLTSGAVK